jgi:hypothetical protein
MEVFVLMLDGGYDGDALLGVYSSAEKAREAAAYLAEADEFFKAEETYVDTVEADAAAKERPSAISRFKEEERRRRRMPSFPPASS